MGSPTPRPPCHMPGQMHPATPFRGIVADALRCQACMTTDACVLSTQRRKGGCLLARKQQKRAGRREQFATHCASTNSIRTHTSRSHAPPAAILLVMRTRVRSRAFRSRRTDALGSMQPGKVGAKTGWSKRDRAGTQIHDRDHPAHTALPHDQSRRAPLQAVHGSLPSSSSSSPTRFPHYSATKSRHMGRAQGYRCSRG